jgi:hypothetical protein
MADAETVEPQGTENVRTAEAGAPEERTETEALGPVVRPNYDARQEQIREVRRPAGPPLLEGLGGPPPANIQDDEPPVDPIQPPPD